MGNFLLGARFALILSLLLTGTAYAAKENDGDDGPEAHRRPLCQTVFAEMSDSYKETLLDIAEDRISEARIKIAEGTFTEEQKLFLWRLMAGRGGTTAIEALADFKFAEQTLEDITSEIALKDPEACLEILRNLRLGQHELFALLKILGAKIDLGSVGDRLGVLTEAQRAELAVIQIKHVGAAYFVQSASYFAITSPAEVAEVAIALMRHEGGYTTEHLESYQDALPHFTTEQRKRIALAFAESPQLHNEWGHFQHLAQLKINELPETDRAEIAGFAFANFVNQSGWQAGYFSYFFKTSYPDGPFRLEPYHQTDILMKTLERVDKKMLRDRNSRDQFLFQIYNGKIMALGAAVPKLRKIIFARDGIATIAEHYNLETLDELHLVDEAASLDLTRALLTFANENPDLLPKDFVTILWDPVRNQSVVLRMLKEYLAQNEGKFDHMPENSLQLISQVTGLKYEDIRESKIQKNPGELYELVMDIQDGLAKPAFKTLPIEAGVFEKRTEFLKLLRALRDLHAQNGDGTKGWKATFKAVGLSTSKGITVDNLEKIYSRAQETLVAAIKEKLAGQNINFSYEQFMALEKQWGDLEPIWTLLSRYQNQGNWNQEVAPLAQVFEASLQGTFREKKFKGGFDFRNDVAMASAQLKDITTVPQRKAWMKPRWKMAVPNEGQAVAEAEQEATTLETVRESLKESVTVPLKAALGNPPVVDADIVETFHREAVQPLLTEKILNGDPIPMVDSLIAELREKADGLEAPEAARILTRIGLEIVQNPESSPQEVRGGLRLVRTLLTSHKEMGLGELPETVKQGLGQADRALKEMGAQATGEFILTVLNADPKFLLTIGNVVNTASCQSYSSGGHIETLLGYVMDANVQAVVSFALKQQQFKSASDFNQVVKAHASGKLSDVVFDGNLRRATFVIEQDGEPLRIESETFPYAYQRQMIKLGTCRRCGKPGMRLEKLYHQQHANADQMQSMHEEIMSDIVQEMGLEHNNHSITVAPSRNPGGVYSDLARGIQTGEYVIP